MIDSVRRDATDKGCHAAGERSYNCRNVSYPGVMSPAWALPPLVEPSAPLLAQEIERYVRGATTRAAAESRPSNWLICSLAGVVDVRGAQERTIAIPGARAIHLDEFRSGAAVPQIPFDLPVVIFCRAGVRSQEAARILIEAAHPDVRSLQGGVLAWVRDVDPAQPRY